MIIFYFYNNIRKCILTLDYFLKYTFTSITLKILNPHKILLKSSQNLQTCRTFNHRTLAQNWYLIDACQINMPVKSICLFNHFYGYFCTINTYGGQMSRGNLSYYRKAQFCNNYE